MPESGRVTRMKKRTLAVLAPAATLAGVALQDLIQKEHALRAQFPGSRPFPVPVGVDRAGTAPVHHHQQRRRAPVQPRSAALGVHVGQEGEQLLRVRHRQRHRERRVSDHQTGQVLRRRARLTDTRPGHRPAGRQGAGWAARPPARLPSGISGQRVGDVVRIAQPAGDRGDQQGGHDRRFLAQHR